MKPIEGTKYGPPEFLQPNEVEKPSPTPALAGAARGDDEVLIKVYAASVNSRDWRLMKGNDKMLKGGSTILSIWSGINFFLASLILTSVAIFKANSPLLVMVFEKSEISSLDAEVIASLNTLTILYNSCSMALSVLVWLLIRKSLIAGQKWAFWTLLFVIGFVEVMAFIASAGVGNVRWQVNVVQSVLYVVGIGLTGYAIFKQQKLDKTM